MRPLLRNLNLTAVCIGVLLSGTLSRGLAEVRTITATGEYRMGDNDTRTDAKRLALLDAKRIALEQVGTHIEAITEVLNLDLAKEEVRAYTAGFVEVVEQTTRTVMEGETTIVRVDVISKIDTDGVRGQINALRNNQDLKAQLLRAEHDAANLRKDLQSRTNELARAKSKEAVEAITRRRRQLINHADVEVLLARARSLLPGSRRSSFILGTVSTADRQYARRLLEETLSFEPENRDAQGLLGIVEFQEGDIQKAVATLRRVAGSEPPSSQAHLNLGMVLQATGYAHSALEEYQIAATLEPDNAEVHAVLSGGYMNAASKGSLTLDQIKEMKASTHRELREAIRLAPQNADYRIALGRLFSIEGDHHTAEIELRKAVALNPFSSRSHVVLGEALLRANTDMEAIKEFQEAIQIDASDPRSHELLGKAYEKLGQMDQAIQAYRSSVRLLPLLGNVDALSGALQKVDKHKEAAQVYRDQLKTLRADSVTGALYRARLQELEPEDK